MLKEIHFGSCGDHVGARILAKKAIRLGYYRPTMYRDAYELVLKCEKCQVHVPIKHVPQMELITIQSAGPFYQWGIDILGPFPEASGRLKFLVVAVDYFTLLIEELIP